MKRMVSVIMSAYKEPIEWVKQAIESILNQTYYNIELIVVVDNPTYTELIDVIKVYKEKDNRITLILNDENVGLVNSLNKALAFCKGDYIARMDADDISLPNRIEEQIKNIKRSKCDLIGGGYFLFEGINVIKAVHNPVSPKICAKILKYSNCIAHPTWLVKKNVYEQLKGYRDIKACEDYDFLVRAVMYGYKVGNISNIVLKYRNNPNSISHKKHFEQKVIMDFVAYDYRNNRITKYTDYLRFLKEDLNMRILVKEQYEFYEQTINTEKNYFKKFILVSSALISSKGFRTQKCVNKRINILKFFDRLTNI